MLLGDKNVYYVELKVKNDEHEMKLPYHVSSLRLKVKADTLIEACDKTEVYFSGLFGVSMVTVNAYQTWEPIEEGAPGNDIVEDDD